MFPNEKIDIVYSIILAVLGIFVLFLCKVYQFYYEWTSFLLYVVMLSSLSVPNIIRRKKQYKKIDKLRKKLDLSIEEIRVIAEIGRYELSDWNWDKSHIPQKKLYLLEDALEKMYLKRYKNLKLKER